MGLAHRGHVPRPAGPRSSLALGASFVKIGERVYLAHWPNNRDVPTLLHVKSPEDLQVFGITDTNYGEFVLDQAAWESRYGLKTDALARGDLPSVIPTLEDLIPSGPRVPPNLDMLVPAPQIDGDVESVNESVQQPTAQRFVRSKNGRYISQLLTLRGSGAEAISVLSSVVEDREKAGWTALEYLPVGNAVVVPMRPPGSPSAGFVATYAMKGSYLISVVIIGVGPFHVVRDIAVQITTSIINRVPG